MNWYRCDKICPIWVKKIMKNYQFAAVDLCNYFQLKFWLKRKKSLKSIFLLLVLYTGSKCVHLCLILTLSVIFIFGTTNRQTWSKRANTSLVLHKSLVQLQLSILFVYQHFYIHKIIGDGNVSQPKDIAASYILHWELRRFLKLRLDTWNVLHLFYAKFS